jgi:hypothetical protein
MAFLDLVPPNCILWKFYHPLIQPKVHPKNLQREKKVVSRVWKMTSSGLAKNLINFMDEVLTVSFALLVRAQISWNHSFALLVPASDLLKSLPRTGLVALLLDLVKTTTAMLTARIALSDSNTFFRTVPRRRRWWRSSQWLPSVLCCWLGWWGWRSKSHILSVAHSGRAC